MEGSVPGFELINSEGEVQRSSPEDSAWTWDGLPLGTYVLRAGLRPCSGSCDYMDGLTDSCSEDVEVQADVSLHVQLTTGQACTISDLASVLSELETLDVTETSEDVDLTGQWRPLARYLPSRPLTRLPPISGERGWQHFPGSVRFRLNGTWTGSDGCNEQQGTYSLSSEVLTMTPSGYFTQVGCSNFPPQEQLDGTVLRFEASGDRFTALDSDGNVVVEYVRAVRWACSKRDRSRFLYNRASPPPGVSLEDVRRDAGSHALGSDAVVIPRGDGRATLRVTNRAGLLVEEQAVARWPNGSWGVSSGEACRRFG